MEWGMIYAVIHIGNPDRIDQRGLAVFSENPAVVFPGYRMQELPSHLADRMVRFVDSNHEPVLAWEIEEDDERRLARIVKCGVRASDDSGLMWEVLVDDLTGAPLVAGTHFSVWPKRRESSPTR